MNPLSSYRRTYVDVDEDPGVDESLPCVVCQTYPPRSNANVLHPSNGDPRSQVMHLICADCVRGWVMSQLQFICPACRYFWFDAHDPYDINLLERAIRAYVISHPGERRRIRILRDLYSATCQSETAEDAERLINRMRRVMNVADH